MTSISRNEETRDEKQTTLVHMLMHNAVTNPDHVFVKWVDKACNVENNLTYEELWHESGLVVDLLRATGVTAGDRIMIAYPFGLEFLSGLFGCMRLGAIACSAYPPNFLDKAKAKHSFAQFNSQVEDAEATIALTSRNFKTALFAASFLGPKSKGVRWIPTDHIRSTRRTPKREAGSNTSIEIKPQDVAFIQYSSGSTGEPKGVAIRHNALTHHLQCISSEMKLNAESVVVTWMPQYHDFALIVGFLLLCTTSEKGLLVVCSPMDFIRNPLLWVDMIEKYNGTITGGPNFSYSLLAKRMKAAGRKLSAPWLVQAFVGAEPIAEDTLVQMEEIGIARSIITTSYGMAEACVRASNAVGDEIRVIDGVVSTGYLPRNKDYGTTVKVASATGDIVTDGEVGEVYLRGANVSLGYWNKPDLDYRFKVELSDGEEYFATGDLGRIVDDRLYVVGRSKELIIINGRNVYPTDIERVVEGEYHDVVRPGSSVAFQRSDADIGLIVEIRKGVGSSMKSVPESFSSVAVKRLVLSCCGVDVGFFLAMKQGSVPKTTSGKLKRVETRQRSMDDTWDVDEILLRRTWKTERGSDRLATSDRQTPQETSEAHGELSGGNSLSRGDQKIRNEEANVSEVMEIFQQILGDDFDVDMSWETIGLSSLAKAELSGRVEEHMLVKVPFNFDERFRTPAELIDYIVTRSGRSSFPVEVSELPIDPARALPKVAVVLIQGASVCFLIFLLIAAFAASIAVSHQFISLTDNTPYYFIFGALPAALPTFLLSMSLEVVVAKWLVIGRYQERQIQVYSTAYLRWWFIDRLLHLWEVWVGVLVIETPLIWIFYRVLGSKLHPRTQIKAFIREFDLVSIGFDTSIKQPVRCRRFGPWTEKGGPSLRFRHVEIGSGCLVDGIVSLGSKVAESVHLEKLSVLAEGAAVSKKSRAVGNPAFCDGKANVFTGVGYRLLFLQTLWLVAELHIFSALFAMSRIVWIGQLYSSWRYSSLAYIILSLLSSSFLSLHVSALLKWVLIGRRKADDGDLKQSSLWVTFSDWACDYHFQTSGSIFYLAANQSSIWNVLLMLHGLDIDLKSGLAEMQCILPSTMNQISARRSYFSNLVSFRSGDKIEVVDSTIGYRAVLSAGIKVHRSTVRTFGDVEESIYDDNFTSTMDVPLGNLVIDEIENIVFFVMLCVSIVPSYEVYMLMNSLDGGSLLVKVLGAFLAVATWFISWLMLLQVSQALAVFLMRRKEDSTHPHLAHASHQLFLTVSWFVNRYWGHWFLLFGTPIYNEIARLRGATIEGDLFFNGRIMHDIHALSFQDKTVIDECQVTAHILIGNNLTVEPATLSGVLHEGCFTLAGSRCSGSVTTEYGPLRPIFGKGGGDIGDGEAI